jgi:hypothetical protein
MSERTPCRSTHQPATGDATALAALPVHEEAGLPMVLIAPGHSSLATEALLLEDSAVLLHARPADMYLAVALVTHLAEHTGAARPAIVQDRSLGHHSDTVGTAVHMVARHYPHLGPVARVVPAGTSQREGLGPVVAGLLDDLQAVLTNLGIVHSRITKHNTEYDKDFDEVYASGAHARRLMHGNTIGCRGNHFAMQRTRYRSTNWFAVRIVSTTRKG